MKLLYLAGVVLTGLAAVVAGVPFTEKDLIRANKLGATAAHHGAFDAVIRDEAPVIDTDSQVSGVTTKKCSRGGHAVLAFAAGSWNEYQRCKSPFVCCDTGLDAEIGCFCKVDTADSSRAQGGNDVHTTTDPNHGRSCFNDRTGIWRCIKGFCAPERYCLDEGKMCQNTDMGPACEPNDWAQHILAFGCTDACQCGCRGRNNARFCPCLEQLAGRSIKSSAENIIKPATETVASLLTKDIQSDESDASASIYIPGHLPLLTRNDETSIHDHVSKDVSTKMDLNHEWASLESSCTPGHYACLYGREYTTVCNSAGEWVIGSYCGFDSGHKGCCRYGSTPGTAYCDCRAPPQEIDATPRGLTARAQISQESNGCTPGQYECMVDRVLIVCDQTGRWKASADCGGRHCCKHGTVPGTAYCDCRPPSPTIETLPDVSAVNLPKREVVAPVCTPGQFTCDLFYPERGTRVIVCNNTGQWQVSSLCGKNAAGVGCCEWGLIHYTAYCKCPPVAQQEPSTSDLSILEPKDITARQDPHVKAPCVPGTYICNPNFDRILVCNSKSNWKDSAYCGKWCCKSGSVAGTAYCDCRNEVSPLNGTFALNGTA